MTQCKEILGALLPVEHGVEIGCSILLKCAIHHKGVSLTVQMSSLAGTVPTLWPVQRIKSVMISTSHLWRAVKMATQTMVMAVTPHAWRNQAMTVKLQQTVLVYQQRLALWNVEMA